MVPLACAGLLSSVLSGGEACAAGSNILPGQSSSWVPNAGWLNWRPDAASGVVVGESFCSGYIYGANLGWIHMGSGQPREGNQYHNDSTADYGVNVDSAGHLRGFAYGANVGWIRFEEIGAPKVDFGTGRLSGFAYGANIGWIDLGNFSPTLALNTIRDGPDLDSDGIPDDWEMLYSADLGRLQALGDFDEDGQSDAQEFLADTDPTDAKDRLQITGLFPSADDRSTTVTWTSKPTRNYLIETRASFDDFTPWAEAGLGLQSADGPSTTRTVQVGGSPRFFRVQAVRLPSQALADRRQRSVPANGTTAAGRSSAAANK